MRRWSTGLACLLPGLVLLACAKKAEPTAGGTAAPDQAIAAQSLPAVGERVRLLKPGATPRRALRYRFTAQETRNVEITLDAAWRTTLGQLRPLEVQLPTLALRVGIQPAPARADQAQCFTFRLDETEVHASDDLPAGMIEELRAELGGLVGLAGSSLVDPRGLTLESDAQLPPEAQPNLLKEQVEELRQQLLGLAVPLPEEPVGVGARWEVHEDLAWVWMRLGSETYAFRGEQTAVYRLTALEGDGLTLAVELTRVFPAQELMADNEVGSPGKLEAMESKGIGHLVVDLKTPVPEGSLILTTHKRMTARLRGPRGPSQESTTDTTSKLTLRPQQ